MNFTKVISYNKKAGKQNDYFKTNKSRLKRRKVIKSANIKD